MLSAYQAVFPECFWTTAHILHILRIFLGSNPNLFSWTQCWNTHPSWRNTHKYLLQHLRVFLTLFQLNWVAKWEQDWNYFLEFSEIGQFPTAHPTVSYIHWCAGNPCCICICNALTSESEASSSSRACCLQWHCLYLHKPSQPGQRRETQTGDIFT